MLRWFLSFVSRNHSKIEEKEPEVLVVAAVVKDHVATSVTPDSSRSSLGSSQRSLEALPVEEGEPSSTSTTKEPQVLSAGASLLEDCSDHAQPAILCTSPDDPIVASGNNDQGRPAPESEFGSVQRARSSKSIKAESLLASTGRCFTIKDVEELEQHLPEIQNRDTLQEYHGEAAQDLLDLSHWLLALFKPEGVYKQDTIRWETLRRGVHRLIVRLIQYSQLLPKGIFLDSKLLSINLIGGFNERVGSGAYADVYKGQYDGQTVAVKMFGKDGDSQSPERSDWCRSSAQFHQRIMREVAIQFYLSHSNICHPLGVVMEKCGDNDRVCFVYPFMDAGHVINYVKKRGAEGGLSRSDMIRLFKQIAGALVYTHDANVTHSDLHAHNILVNDHGDILLTDFGIANFADSTILSVSLARNGASRWMAPEILLAAQQGEDDDNGAPIKHTRASDIFSVGMCMLQIITQAVPFAGLPAKRASRLIMSGNLPQRPSEEVVSVEIWKILCDCWKFNPDERLSAADLVIRLQELDAPVNAADTS